MKWYIFKLPYKKGDHAVAEYQSEPVEIIVQQLAVKHGSITVKSEEELTKE